MVVVPWACRVGVEAAWLGWEEEDERLAAAAASAAWDVADRTAAAVEVERRRQEVHLDVVGRAAPGRAVPEPGEAAAAGSWCTQQYRRETRECFSVHFALSACPDDAWVDERGRMSAGESWLSMRVGGCASLEHRGLTWHLDLGSPVRWLAGWLAGWLASAGPSVRSPARSPCTRRLHLPAQRAAETRKAHSVRDGEF